MKDKLLRLNIQFFADGDGQGSQDADGVSTTTGDQNSPADTDGQTGDKGDTTTNFSPEQEAAIQRMIKSAQDAIRNEYGKKMKDQQSTIDQLKNQGKSKEQLAEEAQQRLEEGQRELLKSKNEFYAAQKLAKEGLDADLLHFVTVNEGDDEEARNAATDEKVQTLSNIINGIVKEQVDAKFKDAGYNPGSGNTNTGRSGFKSVFDTIRANQIKK